MPHGEMYAPSSLALQVSALTCPQWKVLVVDEQTKKLLDNILKEDDILNENITSETDRLN